MFNERAWRCVKDNINKDKINILLCFWGKGHKIAADNLSSDLFIVEPGIGYDEFFAPFCIFRIICMDVLFVWISKPKTKMV